MKNMLRKLFPVATAFVLCSCGGSVDEAAISLLEQAKERYAAGEYNSAKLLIDSLSETYPKAYKTRREAEVLRRDVLVKEKQRDVEFLAVQLQQLVVKRDSMISLMTLNKDSRYQDTGFYTVPSQAIKLNPYNSFLRASVKENGEAYITSFYRGKRIAHKEVKVSCAGSYVMCNEPFMSRSYKELGVYNERRDYKYGADGGIMDFIATGNGPFKVELTGDNGTFGYTLRAEDVAAVVQVLDLSNLLKTIEETNALCDEAQRALDFLRKSQQRSAVHDKE